MAEWRNEHYVTIYDLVRGGCTSREKVAKCLGMGEQALKRRLEKDPACRDAWDRGVAAQGNAVKKFHEYVFGRLPPKLQAVWNDIMTAEERGSSDPAGAYRDIRAIVEGCGQRVRQQLFIYAYTASNFNTSEALRQVGISKATLDRWINNDPGFGELVEELHWHKKNFFENALMRLVDRGEPAAVIFANKTQNRDRGYTDKQVIEHTGTIQHNHVVLDVGALELPFEVREALLEALRAQQAGAGVPLLPGTVHPAKMYIDNRVVDEPTTAAVLADAFAEE